MMYQNCEECGEPVILDGEGVVHDDLVFHDDCFTPCEEPCATCDEIKPSSG